MDRGPWARPHQWTTAQPRPTPSPPPPLVTVTAVPASGRRRRRPVPRRARGCLASPARARHRPRSWLEVPSTCLRTAPRLPPRTISRPTPLPRTPVRHRSSLEACRGLRSSPQAAPQNQICLALHDQAAPPSSRPTLTGAPPSRRSRARRSSPPSSSSTASRASGTPTAAAEVAAAAAAVAAAAARRRGRRRASRRKRRGARSRRVTPARGGGPAGGRGWRRRRRWCASTSWASRRARSCARRPVENAVCPVRGQRPSAALDHVTAQAAPTHPRAQPGQVGSVPWPQQPASARPNWRTPRFQPAGTHLGHLLQAGDEARGYDLQAPRPALHPPCPC